jgi:chromosome segregation ATPase
MSQEKYLNNYVDLLKNTLNDQVARNLQLQANLKTQEEIMNDMSNQLQSTIQQLQEKQNGSNEVVVQREQELLGQINQLKQQLTQVNQSTQSKVGEVESYKNTITANQNIINDQARKINDLQNAINDLTGKLAQTSNLQSRMDESNRLITDLKNEISVLEKESLIVETLRNQLISTQNMVKERDNTIEDLTTMARDLNLQIETLKTTPTPVKKTKKASVAPVSTLETATEDGGSF